MAQMSKAGVALSGLGLVQQVSDEGDDERRRKLIQQQMAQRGVSKAGQTLGLLNAGYASALGN